MSPSSAGIGAVLLLLAWGLGWWWTTPAEAPLVVYCAHDQQYAAAILEDFERTRGIALEVRYDTEATKSLGLVEALRAERGAPRCDVFWNNEPLGTQELSEEGVFEAYRGPGFERIPPRWRDPEGRFAGFAGRLRVWIGREGRVPKDASALTALLAAEPQRATVARPLYGTTRLHLTYEVAQGGLEVLREFDRLVARGLTVCGGNAMTKDRVVAGSSDFGWTDTDDAFEALDRGAEVFVEPWRDAEGRVLCLPNTVSIVRGTKSPAAARALVDHLLSAEVELWLANSPSRQIPLGPVDEALLPKEVRALRDELPRAAPLDGLLAAAPAVLEHARSLR